MLNYPTIDNLDWDRITKTNAYDLRSKPLTVHCPIQPPHSRDLVYVNRSLVTQRLRVLEGLDQSKPETYPIIRNEEMFAVQFALDEPSFVPDYNYSKLSYLDSLAPIVQGEYFAWDLYYKFQYSCRRISESQNLLWITCEVKNEADVPQSAAVRANVNFQKETDLTDYHYVPFYWDNSKWMPCDKLSLQGSNLIYNQNVIGKIDAQDFDCEWETETKFAAEDYNKKFSCGKPYFVHNQLRLEKLQNVIKFSRELEPQQCAKFNLAILTDYKNINADDQQELTKTTPENIRTSVVADFKQSFGSEPTRLEFPKNDLGRVFNALQVTALQMLIKFPDKEYLMPIQGGRSERHFVWVWEAMCMLIPLLKCGHFEPIKKAIDFIFNLQDGGNPPAGRFTSLKGAVGTTSIKWANSTGSALALAADYARYSQDEKFIDEYLPKLTAAADWIVGEIKATRKLNDDGTRPLTYGLMPFASATDGDIGHVVAFTDAFSYYGLDKFTKLLEGRKAENAAMYRKEASQYKNDINQTLKTMAKPSGFIPRQIETGDPEEKISRKFNNIGGVTRCAFVDLFDDDKSMFDLFQKYLDFYERNIAHGPFMGPMDRDIMYIAMPEWMIHDVYLRAEKWKKAFLCFEAFFCAMTPDTFQFQERIHLLNGTYTPWQPNGSNCGRAIDVITKSFYFQQGDTATIFAAMPFDWLLENEKTSLENLHVPGGKISLNAVAKGEKINLTISGNSSNILPRFIKFPEYINAKSVRKNIVGKDNVFEIENNLTELEFILRKI